jgi:hypothetical protein
MMSTQNEQIEQDDAKLTTVEFHYGGKYTLIGLGIIAIIVIIAVVIAKSNEADTVRQRAIAEQYVQQHDLISTDYRQFNAEYKAMTDIQKDDYWKTVQGKNVEWSGEIYDVADSSIAIFGGKFIATHDITAKITDANRERLKTLNKGDKITVRGKLTKRGGLITPWELSDAEIVR